jgi:hypothetical protein
MTNAAPIATTATTVTALTMTASASRPCPRRRLPSYSVCDGEDPCN